MTKYTIYPCTDDTWIKVFRRIRKVAKKTGMRIICVDGKTNSIKLKKVFNNSLMLKQQSVTYLDWCSKRCKSDVPDYTTTIILEKQDERSIRRNRKIGESQKSSS